MTRHTSYIAFDAASKTGWAFRSPSGTWRYGTINPMNIAELEFVTLHALTCGISHAVIEQPFHCRNQQTTIKLAMIVGRIQAMCESIRLETTLIPAKTWQAGIGIHAKAKRAECKAVAKQFAASCGVLDCTEDEADAMCMAEYMDQQARYASLAADAKGGTA